MAKEQPKEMEKWGRDAARERYGKPSSKMTGSTEYCKPCDPIDQHGPDYSNDVSASSWLRSNGEKKPSFDKSHGR